MSLSRLGLSVLLSLLVPLGAWAAPPGGSPTPGSEADRAAQARSLYEKGMARFHLEEYDQAIEEWEAGFRLRPVPEFLYNIAQAHRLANRPAMALKFYQKFLLISPQSSNRAVVERHIAALERTLKQNNAAATDPAPNTRDSTPTAPRPAPDLTPTTRAEPTHVEPAATNVVVAAPPRKKPLYKKAWFWGVIGGSIAAVAIVGVTVGVVVGRRDQPEVLPALRF